MKAFSTIAIPDKDILSGHLTMDVFAADLWDTYLGRGPEEYRDSDTFFRKTYLTEGLKNLLSAVQERLQGSGGDPVIQVQTPFGGGKTHSLIAMYHKSKEWNAKTAVVVGTVLGANDTIWGTIEKQLTGSINLLSGNTSPGRDKIREVLETNQPVLILMDEILEYAIKASGVKVGESTLAAQTIAFLQELTEVAPTLSKTCVVITLAKSKLEHFDDKGEAIYQELQKRAGREEKIYTPVEENEITKVIRRRLFSRIDESEAKEVISEILDYFEDEEILPVGREVSEYRSSFLDSYPFSPEVVQILYERWGSFPSFQRTRGVLRLLSLVVSTLNKSSIPYITPSDFDLSQSDIRRELIKHIGNEFDGIISSDITNNSSGSKLVDKSLGKSYQGLSVGTRASTAIFMYSFSGGIEKGAHLGDIKRSATTTEIHSSVVAEAVEQFKNKLFFLQNQNDRYFFSNQPNLNRILLTKMENVKDALVTTAEQQLLKEEVSRSKLKVLIWPDKARDIPDNSDLKLVILPSRDENQLKEIFSAKGETPRVFKNTIFFLTPLESERSAFNEQVKRRIAYQEIEADKTLPLSEDQKREVRKNAEAEDENSRDQLRRLYRLVFIPSKDGPELFDIGIPTYGDEKKIDDEIYDKLRTESEIRENLSPLLVKEKYLKSVDYAKTSLIRNSMVKTPGEQRILSDDVLERSFSEGIKQAFFGLGELQEDGTLICRYFKEEPTISFYDNEIIIKDSICVAQREKERVGTQPSVFGGEPTGGGKTQPPEIKRPNTRDEIDIRIPVPMGKVSQIMGMMNFLQSKFKNLEIEVKARNGTITEDEYVNKIKEALRQLGLDPDDLN